MRVDRVMATAAAVGATAWLTAHATAPAVRGWSAPNRRDVGDGPLHATATALGDGPVVVALHGITASGRSFGAAFDDLPFVALDVLGFGGSMDVDTEGYTREHHLDALTTTLRGIGVLGRPLVLVGHSMGAVLALHAASRLPGVMGVVAMSAPLYDDEEEGLDRIARTDRLAGLLTTGDLAERVCTWMCNHTGRQPGCCGRCSRRSGRGRSPPTGSSTRGRVIGAACSRSCWTANGGTPSTASPSPACPSC